MPYTIKDIEVRRTTNDAFLVQVNERDIWIPFSQLESPKREWLEAGYHGDVIVTKWIARKKGIL